MSYVRNLWFRFRLRRRRRADGYGPEILFAGWVELPRDLPGDNRPAMSRDRAIAHAEKYFDEGGFFADLARRVAIPTESQNPERAADLRRYLAGEMQPSFERLGFRCRIFDNPVGKYGPFLVAERIEDPALVTVLSYGHGDVIRGQDASWQAGLNPWVAEARGRPALRPRHRRQQGPAQHQPCRAWRPRSPREGSSGST